MKKFAFIPVLLVLLSFANFSLSGCAGTVAGDKVNQVEKAFDRRLERQAETNKERDERYNRWWDKTMRQDEE